MVPLVPPFSIGSGVRIFLRWCISFPVFFARQEGIVVQWNVVESVPNLLNLPVVLGCIGHMENGLFLHQDHI